MEDKLKNIIMNNETQNFMKSIHKMLQKNLNNCRPMLGLQKENYHTFDRKFTVSSLHDLAIILV